ncbi:MAG TPA: hypothetical protein P5163_00390 [Rubrivivax sp.]|nr:hypothetical protein [Rubrivivax sp.]HRY86567.1 hypothetical protein [Rubrivivax sp.]HRZ59022.1 hypothetical protein [Rubrivivax sp.]
MVATDRRWEELNMSRSRLASASLLAGLCLVHVAVSAQQFPHMPTPSEIAVMPEYCQAKMGTNAALSDAWRLRMGPDKYMHLHHYCHGLNAMNRLPMAADKQTRRDLLQRAIQEFDYVIRNWPADFALTIDAKNKRAMAESRLRMQ